MIQNNEVQFLKSVYEGLRFNKTGISLNCINDPKQQGVEDEMEGF